MKYLILAAIPVVAFIIAVVSFRALYRVPGPDEALVITGAGASMTREFKEKLAVAKAAEAAAAEAAGVAVIEDEPDPEFKIVVGKGVVIRPGQRMERLSLAASEAEVPVDSAPTIQGIPLTARAVVIYKVGDGSQYIARAARRFSGNKDWAQMVSNVLEGHLRSVIGTLTVEEIWQNRERLAAEVRSASGEDLKRLGLQIDSFQIKHITDESGYIENISKKDLAEAAKNARIAEANADQLASTREAETAAITAASESQSQIKQAQERAKAETAQAEADQARPLAQAKAEQAVIETQTRNAELDAARVEQELQATVYRQADADKYAQVTAAEGQKAAAVLVAEADAESLVARSNAEAAATKATGEAAADARKAQGLAEAETVKAVGLAEAEGLKARGDALAANREAVIQQDLVKQLPAIVDAAASSYDNVGTLTVLDGAEGLNEGVMGAIGLAAAAIPGVKSLFEAATTTDSGNNEGGGGSPRRRPRPDGNGGGTDGPDAAPAASGPKASVTQPTAPRSDFGRKVASAKDTAADVKDAAKDIAERADELAEDAQEAAEKAAGRLSDEVETGGKIAEDLFGTAEQGLDLVDDLSDRAGDIGDRINRMARRRRK